MVGKLNIYLRLKPSLLSTPDSSFYRINNSTEIQLLVPPNNREPYSFTDIFHQEHDPTCRTVSKECAQSAISGSNVSVISLGAKDSGKTFTVFGGTSGKSIKNSLCYSVVCELFEAVRNTSKEKNFSVTVSYIELANNSVKDLGLAYYKRDEMRIGQVIEILSTQDLEIKEAMGRSYVEDACLIQVINPEEILEVVSLGLKAKELMQSDGDCVFYVSLSQRVNNKTQSSSIFLVDFQSSGSLDTSEDSQMTAMRKVLNKINLTNLSVPVNSIPFRASKLTYLLQGSLINSTVIVVANADTDPARFKETYETLNYTQAIVEIDKKVKLSMMSRSSNSKSTDWARRLRDEISELDANVKKAQTLYEDKLRSFAKLLGIEEDLEVLVLAEKGSREAEICKRYREALQSVKNLTQRITDLEQKNENFKKILNELQVVQCSNFEKHKRSVMELRTQMSEAREQLETYGEVREKEKFEKMMSSTDNLERTLHNSHFVLEEKSALMNTLKAQMDSNTTDLRNLLEIKELSRAELENDYKTQIFDNEYNHKQRIKSLEDSYVLQFKAKEREILKANYESSIKLREVAKQFEEIQKEAVKMFEVMRLQGKAIYEIEKGKYNKGICPVLIPRNHMPVVPNEVKFPMIFEALGVQALEVARVSTKIKNQFSYTPNKSISSSISSSRTAFKEPDKPFTMETSLSLLLETKLANVKINELRSIGNSLQAIIKQNSEKVNTMFKETKNTESEAERLKVELEGIEEDRQKYQEMYQAELRKRMDKEDQGERARSRAFITELASRPGTYRNIHTSQKMLRNIQTSVSGHRLPLASSTRLQTYRPATTAEALYKKAFEKIERL